MIEFDKKQQEAIDLATNDDEKIIIINGKAGSGKSFITKEIEDLLKKQGWLVSKVAPTGKAALRIEGKTIHTWLEPEVTEDKFGNVKIVGFEKESFSTKECLIVDEASMVDGKIWKEIKEVYDNTTYCQNKKIILIGDEGQLQPVGDGTPFINMINGGKVPVVTLDKIHRQADGNDIVVCANKIRDGIKHDSPYKNVTTTHINDGVQAVINDPIRNQIICPMKKGANGTNALNEIIKSQMDLGALAFKTLKWSDEERKFVYDKEINIGDKIIVTRNNFNLDLTNGTIGVVTGVGVEPVIKNLYGRSFEEYVDVIYIENDVNGEELFIPFDFAKRNVDLAYAITIHKSQGSSWENVYISLTKDQTHFVDTRMLYTAITRAEKEAYICSKETNENI